MSNSATQLCRGQSGAENGCKVLGENERHQDFSPRDEGWHQWGWQALPQVGLRPGGLVSQLEEKLVPLLEVSTPEVAAPPANDNRHLTASPLCSLPTAVH